jgi:hypothetical protein
VRELVADVLRLGGQMWSCSQVMSGVSSAIPRSSVIARGNAGSPGRDQQVLFQPYDVPRLEARRRLGAGNYRDDAAGEIATAWSASTGGARPSPRARR